jgi:putative membrane protein
MLSRMIRPFRARLRQNRHSPVLQALLGLYLFIYVWSVPMLMFDLVPIWGRGMGGFLLILQGMIVGMWLVQAGGLRGGVAATAILVLSYLVEFVGVRTGMPFGRYAYTPTLGLQLGGAVPLAIPFAWLLVVPGALMAAAQARRATIVVPLAAILALLLDLLIEPVAAHVAAYWRWSEPGLYYGVPAANFAAWGCTAFVLVWMLHLLVPDLYASPRVSRLPALLFVLNALQFTLVDAAYGFWWAAALGIGLLAGIFLLSAGLRRKKPRREGEESGD